MRHTLIIFTILLLAACGSVTPDEKQNYPLDHEDYRKVKNGSVSGSDEGFNILGGKKDEENKGGSGIGVNSFLWRASLDTISFMPITSADPFGGVIITDWYEDPAAKGIRSKLTVTILDDRLRADGVRVALSKQKLDDKGNWRTEAVSKESEREIENTILTRARELRVKQTGK